ncbi:TIGR03826 family flagellar region protein [Neobacillus drentensis]|uniref:TIGR03826 family flagellar region protein n=1 Tax=Neobacillus drentensis TaxID=220684 RepID=UPI002867AD0F|nr:TIGR03826 family flagellar region protein [Neobacillus drentensis]MDR7235676.1 flagellar operon protein (TIGR03826 family) [Neobacillus drentensis]
MGTPQLKNCPKCGKLFLLIRNICDNCYQKQEDDFLKAAAYLREHSGITIQELSDETGVSVSQIRHFIWAGRILVDNFPNLSYPCETCGNMIHKGRKCSSCMDTLKKLANQVEKREAKAEGDRSHEQKGLAGGYISHYLKEKGEM